MLHSVPREGNMQRRLRAVGNGNLAQAIALLIHNQASFLAQLAETNRNLETTKMEGNKRFARIEAKFEEVIAALRRHEQILNELPEAIRQKIGFKRGH